MSTWFHTCSKYQSASPDTLAKCTTHDIQKEGIVLLLTYMGGTPPNPLTPIKMQFQNRRFERNWFHNRYGLSQWFILSNIFSMSFCIWTYAQIGDHVDLSIALSASGMKHVYPNYRTGTAKHIPFYISFSPCISERCSPYKRVIDENIDLDLTRKAWMPWHMNHLFHVFLYHQAPHFPQYIHFAARKHRENITLTGYEINLFAFHSFVY